MVDSKIFPIELGSDIQRTLTDNISDMLWVKDLEGRYIYANKAICDILLMANDTNEPIGKTDLFFGRRERAKHPHNMLWHTFDKTSIDTDNAVVNANSPMSFEETGNVSGQTLHLELHKAPLYDSKGKISGTVGSGRDITELVKIKKELLKQKDVLHYQAHHDPLTDLPNRILFQDRLEQALLKSKRGALNVALLYIDLDHFKNINDAFGHDRGDKILQIITQRISQVTRETDTLSRLGADEFTLIIDDVTDLSFISHLTEKILSIIKEPVIINETHHHLTASIGICTNCDENISGISMLKHADSAMFRAKERGRNTFEFYSEELTRKVFERFILETELRSAIKDNQLEVHFQPKIDLLSGMICGMESLIRWQHPKLGQLSPASFIPLAEESGLIIEIDRWVYRQSILHFQNWYELGLFEHNVLALNLSIRQLEQTDLLDFLDKLIFETGVNPTRIEFEITETQMMQNMQSIKGVLKQIEELGIRLAIDDFGTGYSSLAYLKQLKLDTLKIDRSFIDDLPSDEDDTTIVRAILAMAKGLKLHVVAEGVETREQLDFLKQEGCLSAQGYLLARPLSACDMEQLLKDNVINKHCSLASF